MKSGAFVAALLGGAGALVFNAAAFAQATDNAAKTADSLEEVVVTGSRVITNGNNSPTPVTVIDAQDLLSVRPGTISDALNSLPVLSGSNGTTSNPNTGIGAGGGGNGARSSLNLRNLGEARTLVLLDGHRVPTTTSTNVVDSDMIPQLMLKRVDLVTGGTSAVYGSDAIAGVINFVTDRNFNGVKVNAQTGLSSMRDDRQYQIGAAWGTQLGSKAHIEASYEFHDDKGIPNRSSRPNNWLCGMLGNGTTIPDYLSCGVRRFDATFGGLIRTGALANQQFVGLGVLAPFNLGPGQTLVGGVDSLTGLANIAIGGDGAWQDASLKSSLRSHQLFGRVDYDFTDSLHGYVEVAGNKKINSFYGGYFTIGTSAQISRTNAFLPAAIVNAIPTTQTTFNFGKFIYGDTRQNPVIDEKQIFVMSGLEGKLGNYDWTVGLVHGDARLEDVINNNTNNFRLAAALDAVKDTSGNIVCRVTTTNPTVFPGCVPINVFGWGAESQQALDYVKGTTNYVAKTKQDEFSGSISGNLFNTWAGPFVAALSAEWRKQKFGSVSTMPPANPLVATDCLGLGLRPTGGPVNCTATTSEWGNTFANRSDVSQTVKEAAFEFDAPLLKDVMLAKEVNLNGAVRYTNYDTSGSYNTWKVGLDWHLNDSWRVRATKSRDIRAPTLDDLFAPPVGTPQNITDTLLNSNSQAPRFQSGNSTLTAEIGHTSTVGVVWQPQAAPGFSVSVDGFNIEVTNAILVFNGTDVAIQNACYASGGTSFWCSLQQRALGNFTNTPTNVVTQWFTKPFNIAAIHTWGGDLEINWSTRLGSHPFTARGMLTWQPHLKYVRPFLATVDQGGASYGFGGLQASPSTRATLQLRYGITERLSADWQTRYRNSMAMIGDPSIATTGTPVPGAMFSGLNLNYRMPVAVGTNGKLDIFLNVQNIFNALPPVANFYGTASNIGTFGGFAVGDDIVGRYFTAGVRLQF
jgi:outer membrane receptor protein involved in Fe transport